MSLRVTFELRDSDLSHFRTIMREARDAADRYTADEILQSSRGLLNAVQDVEMPDFVGGRINKIKTLIDMVEDEEWQLPEKETGRVMNALAYFTEPEDLIPDHVPGLGFLDDAIMVELVCREFKYEIQAYTRFCKIRTAELARGDRSRLADSGTREEWLARYRKELHDWMRMRRREGRRKAGRRTSQRSPFTLF